MIVEEIPEAEQTPIFSDGELEYDNSLEDDARDIPQIKIVYPTVDMKKSMNLDEWKKLERQNQLIKEDRTSHVEMLMARREMQ